jgi:flagellar biosynthesis/type III secretory pathway chaperone
MADNPQTRRLLSNLEDILVQEFRTLESLIGVTREERLEFSKHNADSIMLLVEKKEMILDQLSLLEEKRRTIVQNISQEAGLQTSSSSISAILSSIDRPSAERISRLNDGIATLVSQARDLNYGNQALARTALDCIETTKAFLYSLYQPQTGYQAPGGPQFEQEALWDVEHRV